MKQILSALILIAALVSLGVGGTLAAWVESDSGGYAFRVGEWDPDRECTIGWWKNWDNHLDDYPNLEADIYGWLYEMNNPPPDWDSQWLMDDMIIPPSPVPDGVIDAADMVELINQKDDSRKAMFLAQYLVQRLNQMSGMQSPSSLHDVTLVPTYDPITNYLGLGDPYNASGQEILQKIEDKYNESELAVENAYEYEIMKDVCDWLNNLRM